MADKTIEWLHGVRAQDAHKPFFVYFSTGCSHAPHHVATEWADKYKGKFDQGWDRLREEIFARQKAARRRSPPTPSSRRGTRRSRRGTTCPTELKAFYARQMEVYAGYSENADHNVGRVIDAIEELGELDNTLVIWIWGDNGASMEGTITGSFNELTMQNGIPLTDEMQLQLAERYGGIGGLGRGDDGPALLGGLGVGRQHPVPVGQAGRLAPRRHAQPDGRALARARSPTPGALRSQFTHVIDVGADDPRRRRASRRPTRSTGSSRSRCTASTFADSLTDAGAPERHTQQYFETIGNRAMYKDGWWLAMKTAAHPVGAHPRRAASRTRPGCGTPTPTRPSCTTCPTTSPRPTTSRPSTPRRSQELKELFWAEAERYKVLPLLATLSAFFGMLPPLPEVADVRVPRRRRRTSCRG